MPTPAPCYQLAAIRGTKRQQQHRQQPRASQPGSSRALPLTVLAAALLAAAVLVAPAAAATTHTPAHIQAAPHHAGCGMGVPCSHESAAHNAPPHHPVAARQAHYGGAHHHAAAKHPTHKPADHPQHQNIKGVSSIAAMTPSGAHFDSPGHHHTTRTDSHRGDTHAAAADPLAPAAPAAIGADVKPTSCHSWGSEAHKETEEDKLDRHYGIDPETGLAPTEEDAAEAEILHEAKQAGMDPLEYVEHSDEATFTSSHVDVYADAASHSASVQESLERGFRLTYMFNIWFKTSHSPHEGDVQLLTKFSSASNHGLLDSFGSSLKAAVHSLMPEGIAELHTINWIPGNPLEVELVIYPDLLIPDELNPAWVLQQTDHIMAALHTNSLGAAFREQWLIDEVQVQAMPDNGREIEDAREMFGTEHDEHGRHHRQEQHIQHHGHYDSHHHDYYNHLDDDRDIDHYYGHEHGQQRSSSGIRLSSTLALIVFVVCPMLAAAALLGHALLKVYTRYPARRVNKMLPKYPGFETYPASKSGRSSSGGVGDNSSNIAAVYAAPMEYYAGPYRNVYSSSGGGSSAAGGSSARSSLPGSSGGQQQDSAYATPASTDGGAQ